MPVRRINLFCLLSSISLCLCVSILSLVVSPAHAQAASNPITVLSETETGSFPNSITFQLKAQDTAGQIAQASLILTSNAPDYLSELHPVKVAQPASIVTLSWQESTTGDHFLVPGTPLTYYWELQDSHGTYDLPQQHFSTSDTRFSWQHLTQGMVEVNWYNQPTDFGQGVLDQVVTSVASISSNLGGSPQQTLHLWIYQSRGDFQGALPPNTHEWVGGIAFPSIDEAFIVVGSLNDDTLIRDMPHELTHLVFHQLIANGIESPLWFDEGLAVYNQLYHEPEMTLRLKQALASHSLIPLSKLYFEFPADASQAYLAYAQSWNLVSYMYQTFGRNKMTALIKDMKNTNFDFSQDLTMALGEDADHLENQWHLYLHQPPTLVPTQVTPTTSSVTDPVQIRTSDSNAPLYIFLGLLLILLPIAGGIVLFIYQRQQSREYLNQPLSRQAPQEQGYYRGVVYGQDETWERSSSDWRC
jgi:hypothetical protein